MSLLFQCDDTTLRALTLRYLPVFFPVVEPEIEGMPCIMRTEYAYTDQTALLHCEVQFFVCYIGQIS